MTILSKHPALLIAIMSVMVLSGCKDRVKDAQQQMQDIRNSSAQPIEPPPKTEVVEDFTYSASNLRSPFMPPSLLNVQNTQINNEGVRPDVTRQKEQLEQFELSTLVFRGQIISPEGQQFGLVQRPDGTVASVKVGDYIGLNDGRIVEITPTQINLIEIVPDSRAGFVEKPASLTSPIG